MMNKAKKNAVFSAIITSAIFFSVASVYGKAESHQMEDNAVGEENGKIAPPAPAKAVVPTVSDSLEMTGQKRQAMGKVESIVIDPRTSSETTISTVPDTSVSVQEIETADEVPEIMIDPQTSSETTDSVVFDNQDGVSDQQSDLFSDKYIKGRLQLGTRTVFRKLTDGDSGHKGGWYGSGTFLGTIYGLDEKQYPAPVYFYIQYLLNKHFAVELAYDRIEAETKAMGLYPGQPSWDLINGREKTDGDVILSGPVLSLIGRFPNKSDFTPFVRFGLGFMSAEFKSTSAWEYPGSGVHHVMNVDDKITLQLGIGVEWQFYQQWSLNASVRYTEATVDANFNSYNGAGVKTQPAQPGEYPLDNVALLLGVMYSF